MKKTTSVYLEESLLRKLDSDAEKLGVTRSDLFAVYLTICHEHIGPTLKFKGFQQALQRMYHLGEIQPET